MKRDVQTVGFTQPASGTSVAPRSEQFVHTSFPMTARLEAQFRILEDAADVGSMIWVRASLALSGVDVRMMFRNRERRQDRPLEEVLLRIPLIAPAKRLSPPGQTVRAASPGTLLTLRLFDHRGLPLCDEREIGECAKGIHEATIPFNTVVNASAWVAAHDWPEGQGPRIRLSGELVFPRGVMLRLGFRSLHRGEETGGRGTEYQMIRPGMTLSSTEKTIECGMPGLPWISVLFVNATGSPIGEEHLVGRCVSL